MGHIATQPQASGPANEPPFGAMLRGALVPMLCTAPVIVLVSLLTRQARGGLAALLGAVIAVAFFAGGLYAMKKLTNANPLTLLAGALAVFFGQVIFLGFVILAFRGASWLDGTTFGLSVLAVSLVWQVSQVVVFVRLRKRVYDEPVDQPGPVDEQAMIGSPDGSQG